MSGQIERDVRFLKRYAIVTSAMLALIVLFLAAQPAGDAAHP